VRRRFAKARKPPDGFKSKLEKRYADHLALQQKAGAIAWWGYEALTFKLADNARFTPDFVVITRDYEIEIHETKGHMREAAAVRIKVAASQFYWLPFFLIYSDGKTGWRSEGVGVAEMPRTT
jgi:hypothetical protein